MNNQLIQQLHSQFQAIWLQSNADEALAKWQQQLSVVITDDLSESEKQVLATAVSQWQQTIKQNRRLLVQEQSDLKALLTVGQQKQLNANKPTNSSIISINELESYTVRFKEKISHHIKLKQYKPASIHYPIH